GWLAWKVEQGRTQREAVQSIERLGGKVKYDYELTPPSIFMSGDVNARPKGPVPGPAWLHRLMAEDCFRTVKEGELRSVSISSSDLEVLRALGDVQSLDLEGTFIIGNGLDCLKNMRQLRSLNVSRSAISDASLSKLPVLPELERLSLCNTSVTAKGVRHLE